MAVYIGSARIDENGKLSGGKAGDQKQTSTPDYSGEVSMQKFYVHSKGWIILRPKKTEHALELAGHMITACNNKHLGYNQFNRHGVIYNGINTKKDSNCDCSELVRACVIESTGVVVPDFNTATEVSVLMKTGLFERIEYTSNMTLYTGDILVTKTKGHTAIVTVGAPRVSYQSPSFYPPYQGNTTSIVVALSSVGEKDTSYKHRAKIAKVNEIIGYRGTSFQNTKMLNLLKLGKLKKG